MHKLTKTLTMAIVCFMSAQAFAVKSIKSLPIEFAGSEDVSYDGALDLNKATIGDLAKLKGMSKERAESIIKYRKEHGKFSSFYELSQLRGFKGLKDGDLKRIEGQLKIG